MTPTIVWIVVIVDPPHPLVEVAPSHITPHRCTHVPLPCPREVMWLLALVPPCGQVLALVGGGCWGIISLSSLHHCHRHP